MAAWSIAAGGAATVMVLMAGGALPQPERRELSDTTREGRLSPLLEGLGDHHVPVTTDSAMAQRYFDQGMVLAYGFNHAEAERSFREAARIDPGCAMAWWGVALVNGPNINDPMTAERVPVAWESLQQAFLASPGASDRERDLIEALATRYSQDPEADRAALDAAYAEAMRALHEEYPDDTDIATLYVESVMDTTPWNYWTPDGYARPGIEEVISTLERVMSEDPGHPGAPHLYIHLVESSSDPYRGEAPADRLATLTPGAGHLVHMPAHIYLRIGRYKDAADANVRAVAADEGYLTQCRMQGIYPAGYYPHNIHFLWAGRAFNGQRGLALAAAEKLARTDCGDEEGFQHLLLTPLACRARFAMWDEVLATPAPDPSRAYFTGFWRYARGLAENGLGRPDSARVELARLREIIESDELEESQVFVASTPKQILTLGATILEGEIELDHGDVDAAIALLDKATRLYDAMPYNEPEDWYYPPRHALGAALIEAGRYEEAEVVYWQDLRRHPRNGWAVFGLVQAMEGRGADGSEVDAVRRQFEDVWEETDVSLVSSRY